MTTRMVGQQAEEKAAEVDLRTDVYAMGTILCEMLAGRPPFTAESLPTLLYKIVHQEPPTLRSLQLELSPSVEYVIAKALRKKPEERFQSMSELWRAFASAIDQEKMKSSAPMDDDRQPHGVKASIKIAGERLQDATVQQPLVDFMTTFSASAGQMSVAPYKTGVGVMPLGRRRLVLVLAVGVVIASVTVLMLLSSVLSRGCQRYFGEPP